MKMTIRILGWLINLIALFLFLTTAILILMGGYAMIIFMLFLILASKLPLGILIGNTGMAILIFILIAFSVVILKVRLGDAFQVLFKSPKHNISHFAGEMAMLLIAAFIRFAIWRISTGS